MTAYEEVPQLLRLPREALAALYADALAQLYERPDDPVDAVHVAAHAAPVLRAHGWTPPDWVKRELAWLRAKCEGQHPPLLCPRCDTILDERELAALEEHEGSMRGEL